MMFLLVVWMYNILLYFASERKGVPTNFAPGRPRARHASASWPAVSGFAWLRSYFARAFRNTTPVSGTVSM